ncbi:4-hydroxy-tetrahydrodipicolinate synthase [Cryptosporangium phraense]|uniref:4-hydroxy-tetrahydrodipicolinate synthase n=1 Tax=Cryptosporangium phraense TaxID=2593070 RepID=A0A545AU19_9ACTN|nr:4-hydroxy-tetrahydrodipicolinate synthase [Cryptosporangium phraense]TQS44814.1 4-hydroxy-tetrahydrodipicolinate synthase [Cryptosporangium phraense]
MSADPRRPFGRVLTAMVTPFGADGSLDLKGAQKVAEHLVDVGGNDGLIVNGTTGEAPTMSDAEKESVLRAVIEAVGDRATIVAGAGNNDTHHSIDLVRTAEKAGADGVLIVSPYYNKPPQAGLVRHVRTLADASDLPVMLYDIPHRTGVAFATETLIELAEHPRVLAVKDAKGDLAASAEVLANTDLAYYSGDDVLTLPLLSVGAVGVVSVTGHLVAPRIRQMIEAFERGDVAAATALHHGMLPVDVGIFRTQAAILTKAAYNILGLPGGSVRSPLVDATPEQIETLRADLARGGVELGDKEVA